MLLIIILQKKKKINQLCKDHISFKGVSNFSAPVNNCQYWICLQTAQEEGDGRQALSQRPTLSSWLQASPWVPISCTPASKFSLEAGLLFRMSEALIALMWVSGREVNYC